MLEFLEQALTFILQPYVYAIGAFIVFLIINICVKADAINSKKDPDEFMPVGLFIGGLCALIWPAVVGFYLLYLANLFLNVLAKMFSESSQNNSKES